jgi:uncharacterized protein DUF1761
MKIKYPAVIVAALVHYILGGLWYSPLLFGNKFLQIRNFTPQQLEQIQTNGAAKELAIALVTSVVLVYILAHFVQYTKAKTAWGGIETAFWLWLGFIATTQLATVLFEQRPLGLYLINISYQLVGCALAGVILAIWRPQESTQAAAQLA